jgi:hypothetical protein
MDIGQSLENFGPSMKFLRKKKKRTLDVHHVAVEGQA